MSHTSIHHAPMTLGCPSYRPISMYIAHRPLCFDNYYGMTMKQIHSEPDEDDNHTSQVTEDGVKETDNTIPLLIPAHITYEDQIASTF